MTLLCCMINAHHECPMCAYSICEKCLCGPNDDHAIGSLYLKEDLWFCPKGGGVLKQGHNSDSLEIYILSNVSTSDSINICEQLLRSKPNGKPLLCSQP